MGGAHSLPRSENEISHLNEDIIFNILTFLPSEKVFSLRCVCKSWYNIIQSSAFIEAHLHNQISKTAGLITTTVSNSAEHVHIKVTNLPPLITNLVKVQDNISLRSFIAPSRLTWATCNGLVLFGGRHGLVGDELFIVNPVTKKILKLPSTTHVSNSSCNHSFGFSYVASTRKYQILHSFITKWELGKWIVGCEVLALGEAENKWRLANQYHTTLVPFFQFQEMVFIENVAHWLVQEKDETRDFIDRYEKFVLSLDMMDNNKFYKTKLPSISEMHQLMDIRGRLSFISLRVADIDPSRIVAWFRDTEFEVWGLKDLLKGIWVKQKRNIKLEGVCKLEVTPVASIENGQAIVFRREFNPFCYFVYDLELQMMRTRLDIPAGSKDRETEVLPHIDTLVSCKNI